jgi:LmbE family N-acetylglucosaminyl deacetylase
MRKLSLSIFLFLLASASYAQPTAGWTSADMYLGIRKLNVLGSVLYIAAHPDDENTRLITYFSKDKLYRAGYLSLTRGDGGQNLIGDEQGIELGLIRTQELLSARRMDGGEQFFTRAYDFGYSKTPEETFIKWDKEKILSDVVWVIRKFQPDVIVTRFPTTGEGGHGHHTASAILANEAFTAAADPARFPEQLSYVKPWQAKRVLWNSFNFGGTNTQSPDQFKFDVGGYNPLLGKSYGEIAAISRSNHKSQGFGSTSTRGEAFEYFKTTGGTAPSTDIMEGVELDWKRVKGAESIATIVDSLAKNFDFLSPDKSVKGLVRLYKALKNLPESFWKSQKMKETEWLIQQCSGLFLDVTTSEQFAVQTDSIRFSFSMNNRLGADIELQRIVVDQFDTVFSRKLERNKNFNLSKTIFVPATKPITQPYWLVNEMAEGYFNVTDQQKQGQADVDPAFEANIWVVIDGERFNFIRPVKFRFTDPVKGEIYWPVSVIPPFTLNLDPKIVIITRPGKPAVYQKTYTSNRNNNLIKTSGAEQHDSLMAQRKQTVTVEDSVVLKPEGVATNGEGVSDLSRNYSFTTDKGQEIYDQIQISYDHIPAIVYFRQSDLLVEQISLKTFNRKIGYIVGAGDKVPDALEQMGYEVTLLTAKEMARNNLKQYDAIITGVRSYNTNDWMNKYYDKLMKYVNDGGNLIVQYNTSNQIGPVRAKIGPYPFDITRTRITDEQATVTLLKPDHPAFNFPNKITADDFRGWVQERSIYHARDTSGRYEKLISMADPGEKPDDGSLIVGRYGKGWFTYTGIVFFRELPAGVPGAYRLLANLIALNKKKGF